MMCRDAKDNSALGSDDPLVSKATEMSVPIIWIRMSSLKGVVSKAILQKWVKRWELQGDFCTVAK